VAPDAPEARAQCKAGIVKACTRIFELEEKTPETLALAEETLSSACARDRAAATRAPRDADLATAQTCSCGGYATVLAEDPAREVEGMVLLDEACTRGLLEACDLGALIADLCQFQRSAVCDDLLAQGRVSLPGPQDNEFARPGLPPAEFRTCFEMPVAVHRRYTKGTVLCFGEAELSIREPSGEWDRRELAWRGWSGVGVWIAEPDPQHLTRRDGDFFYGSVRLLPVRDPCFAREAALLPSVRETCARADKCEAAARAERRRRDPVTTHEEEPTDYEPRRHPLVELGEEPRTLRGCWRRLPWCQLMPTH
jgi:hypothetical protein